MSKVVIIGGGIAGLFTAYYLVEDGHDVTILDKGNLTDNCSSGNAGMIVPSHIVPLSSPGIIAKGLKWMFSASSPFYIHPKLDRKLLQWCLLFYKASTKKHVEMSMPYLKNLSLLSKGLHVDFVANHPQAQLGYEEKGLLMLYKTDEAALEEEEFAHVARQQGLGAEILSASEVQEMEPNAQLDVKGAVFFPGDAHLNPAKLNQYLVQYLEKRSVKILRETEVVDFRYQNKNISTVLTNKGDFDTDYLIVCGGASSGMIAKKLKINLPLLGGKGYSFMTANSPAIQRPAILVENKVAVTPFGNEIRFGGTMEITEANNKININRVKGIHNSIQKYYSNFQCPLPNENNIWSGYRPCSPDGLPYIGFTRRWDNVLFGTGHGMMGVSLAPATGKILAEQLRNSSLPVLIDAFSPDRYV